MVRNAQALAEDTDVQECETSKEVGLLFYEERSRRQLSIKDVSQELHIRQLYISCIEEGKLSELPGYVYTVGFIKSYARFLDLNGDEILRRLSLGTQNSSVSSKLNIPISTKEQQAPSKKVLFASLTLFFVGILLAYVYSVKEEGKSVENYHDGEQSSTLMPSPDPLEITQPDVSSLDAKPFQETKGEVESPDPILVAKTPKKSDPVPVNGPDSREKQIEMAIVAVKDSWVQVIDNQGKNVYVRLMHAGEKFVLPPESLTPQGNKLYEAPYSLNTGNGGGIKVIMNGQTSKPLGTVGKIIRGIILSQENLMQFMEQTQPDSGKPLQ